MQLYVEFHHVLKSKECFVSDMEVGVAAVGSSYMLRVDLF